MAKKSLLTVTQVADTLVVSRATVYNMVKDGRIKVLSMKPLRIPESEILRLFKLK